MVMQDVPGDGFCFLHGLQSCLHDQGMPIRLQNEIHENFQHYKAFFSSEVNQQEIETKVFQYVTQRHFNTDIVDIYIGAAANALYINLYIFEMYNNGRVAAIC